jgi:metal-responsive CopG/Arc/MetJ family transcriptional regulator
MIAIRVVVDEDLLHSADRAARQLNVSRSAFIRDALREHLRRLRDGEACNRSANAPAESLVEFFQSALGGSGLDLSRKRDATRTIKW